MRRIVDIPAIENGRLTHQALHSFEVRITESLPLRNKQKGFRAFQTIVVIGRQLNAGTEDSSSLVDCFGIVSGDDGAVRKQTLDDLDGRRVAHVVCSRLESKAPNGKLFVAQVALEMITDLFNEA